MVRIAKAAILDDLKRNWIVFVLIVGLSSFGLVRNGGWIIAAVPVLVLAGLIVRYTLRGWLEFGRD